MTLKKRVTISRRFLKSIRIDTDLGDGNALDGFVCTQSSGNVLRIMAQHVSEVGQGAFTWTGPYGGGKSSLAVVLGALLAGNASQRKKAASVLGESLSRTLISAFPTGTRGWRIVPVVGRRDNVTRAIGEALHDNGIVSRKPRSGWTERNLIAALVDASNEKTKSHGGVILCIDEMGKFLEGAALGVSDIYVLQQLAEVASRSKGRLLVVGILHQAFEEYAHRLSHEMRDEWAKIQGRFIDLVVDASGEEQIELLSKAIISDHRPKKPSALATTIAAVARPRNKREARALASQLEACWPLHPAVPLLLGPISRRRFGQNQRSIFGFLNSAEPHGFQDFVARAAGGALYTPDQLWDYLRANLEPSILASPDGHRWALAAEALERCESIGGDSLHIRLLKTIALIDLFKERSGLLPSSELLQACFADVSSKRLKHALTQLDKWSFTVFKKFLGAHAIFAGSDFDIDLAVRKALEDVGEIDYRALKTLGGLQPILAKRTYHSTGALRWFDVAIAPLSGLKEIASTYVPTGGTLGHFLLVIPTQGESEEVAHRICREVARLSGEWDIVVGVAGGSWTIVPLARELAALESVSNSHPELAGDAVARREVSARQAELRTALELELHKALDRALWFRKHHEPKPMGHSEINVLASELADARFSQAPRLHNELLNRHRPSSNAISAQNNLLRRMVLNEGDKRLGIVGFPAEGGLYTALLESTGLYAEGKSGWHFEAPTSWVTDPYRLAPMWKAAASAIQAHSSTVAISEIFNEWRKPPYGVKDGLMPVMAVAFILSQRNNLAVYRDGIFRARFDDTDVERLAKDPASIQLRWMDLSETARQLLSAMAQIVRDIDPRISLVDMAPIDVARGLVSIYDQLPKWTKRTMRLSANAVQVRDLFKRANDPNKFLFDDIPGIVGDGSSLSESGLAQVVDSIREGLYELVGAYPQMVHRLRDIMLSGLQVPNLAPHSLEELRGRAVNIRQLAGDFRLDAFIGRLSNYDGSDTAIEGIASLAANKPPRDWADPDLDSAAIEISDMANRFLRAEAFAHVKGRRENRQAMAIVIGTDGKTAPLLEEFDVSEPDRAEVFDLVERISVTLEASDQKRRAIILAALAELSGRYMRQSAKSRKRRATQ